MHLCPRCIIISSKCVKSVSTDCVCVLVCNDCTVTYTCKKTLLGVSGVHNGAVVSEVHITRTISWSVLDYWIRRARQWTVYIVHKHNGVITLSNSLIFEVYELYNVIMSLVILKCYHYIVYIIALTVKGLDNYHLSAAF